MRKQEPEGKNIALRDVRSHSIQVGNRKPTDAWTGSVPWMEQWFAFLRFGFAGRARHDNAMKKIIEEMDDEIL